MGLKWDCPADLTCSGWALSYFWDCICGPRDLISFCLGVVSIICWAVAELPQIFQGFSAAEADGTSVALLLTWMMGDIFNFFGCLVNPGTIPTQLCLATLFCATTFPHVVQQLWISYRKWLSSPSRGESRWPSLRIRRLRDDRSGGSLPSPLTPLAPSAQSLPTLSKSQEVSVQREAFSLPARPYLRDGNRHSASVPVQPTNFSHGRFSDSWRRLTAADSFQNQSGSPAVRGLIFSAMTIATVTGISSLGFSRNNGLKKFSSGLPWSMILTGRSSVLDGGTPEDGTTMLSLGLILGILMAFAYLTGRLPQCMLNCSQDFNIGVPVSTMVFTFLGNGTYLGSILVRGVGWSHLMPVLPWVFDVSCCLLMDISMVTQYVIRQREHGYEYLA